MRWPIRNQIFLPFALLLILSVVLVAAVSAVRTAEYSRQQKLKHLNAVATAIGDGNFPLNQPVIDRMSKMIDGDVIVTDPRRKVTATTLPDAQELADLLHREATPESTDGTNIEWNDQTYFVTTIDRLLVPPPRTLFILIREDDMRMLQQDSVRPILLAAAPTLIVAIVLSLALSRRIGIRIDHLRTLFAAISEGEFKTLPATGRNDELRDLLVSANELSEQLNTMRNELIKSQRLELLGQLSGGLAHQLRNSITGARVAIQLHEKQGTTDKGLLQTALAQLKLTEEQVAAVLSLRPEDKETPTYQSIELIDLLNEIRELLGPQCNHWKTTLSLEGPAAMNISVASPNALKGAILNLTINALQAAGTDGEVRIITSQDDESVSIDVRDNGPGFDISATDSLGAFTTTKPDGIGLGLTIANFAVTQEGGQLEISRMGQETSVCMRLPMRPKTLGAAT